MTEAKFELAKQIITKIGVNILEYEYHNNTFGSLFITIDKPKTRIVWDGKDRELTISAKKSSASNWRLEYSSHYPEATVQLSELTKHLIEQLIIIIETEDKLSE